jgi:pyroglutamyl-peptidase
MSPLAPDLRELERMAAAEPIAPATAPGPEARELASPTERVILVTGFEPFGTHTMNPSQDLAKALDGRRAGRFSVAGVILPVHHAETSQRVAMLIEELAPVAVVHLGLAESRARFAVERGALNVMDYRIPDNAGYRAEGEPCAPDGPAAYFSTLPVSEIVSALTAEGIPAYVSNTAGTFLCNQTLYRTLHEIATRELTVRAGFIHVPQLPAMVAASGLDQPSMDFPLMLRAVELALRVIAGNVPP